MPGPPSAGRLLVIGGTQFAGAHLVAAALRDGWDVTLIHRGASSPAFFAPDHPRLTRLLGDRDPERGDALAQLSDAIARGARWDGGIDTCGYVPRVTRCSAEALRHAADLYLFVSSVSVYDRESADVIAEDGPLLDASGVGPGVETIDADTYGPLKILCERSVAAVMGESRACIVRPALIVGPGDPTDRFTYWPRRLHGAARDGSRILAPGDEALPAGCVDARDLGEFYLRCVRERLVGVFNASGMGAGLTTSAWLGEAAAALGVGPDLVRASASDLEACGVRLWTDLPVFTPPGRSAMHRIGVERASDAGLTRRPMADTVRDTLAWDDARGRPELKAGLSSAREREALDQLAGRRDPT